MEDSTDKIGTPQIVPLPSPYEEAIPEWNALKVEALVSYPIPKTDIGKDRILPIILFVLTGVTTLLAGSYQAGGRPMQHPSDLIAGIPFGLTLMLILLIHEMGHYVTSKAYGVNTSLPYFIPGPWFPFGIGTFGAFIRIQSPIMGKPALLDIGAAGPFAGFIVALAAIGVGLPFSEIVRMDDKAMAIHLGDPLAFSWMVSLFGKVPPEGFILILHPITFAGWIGLLLTSLNLLPLGQFDGGHIAYAMFGKRHKGVSIGMVALLVFLGYRGWKGWYLWAAMAALLGMFHPPTNDEEVPLDFKHRLRGIAAGVLFIVTFMPVPIQVG